MNGGEACTHTHFSLWCGRGWFRAKRFGFVLGLDLFGTPRRVDLLQAEDDEPGEDGDSGRRLQGQACTHGSTGTCSRLYSKELSLRKQRLWKLTALDFARVSWKPAGWPVSFQKSHYVLETQRWIWARFLGNRLAGSGGAVSNTQLFTVCLKYDKKEAARGMRIGRARDPADGTSGGTAGPPRGTSTGTEGTQSQRVRL